MTHIKNDSGYVFSLLRKIKLLIGLLYICVKFLYIRTLHKKLTNSYDSID